MMPRLLAGALLLLASLPAFAGQVGQLTATTHLGQPLSARIELFGFSAAAIDGAELALAADITAGAAERAAVAGLTATPARYGDGTPYIRLTSSQPITEPVMRLRLRLTVEGRTRIARHTLALVPAPAPRAVRRPAPTAQPLPVITTSSTYGPVRSGQTLWRILRELGLTGSGQQALIERIVSASPDAFVNGDADRLRVGAMLTIPATAEPLATTTIRTDRPAVESPAPRPDEAINAPVVQATPAAVTAADPAGTAPAASVTRAATATTPAADIAARQARIEALTQKFAAIRARYERQQSGEGSTQEQAAGSASAAAARSPAAAIGSEARAPVAAPVTATKTARQKTQTAPAAADKAERSLGTSILLWVAGFISLIALLGGLAFGVRQWQQRRELQIDQADDERTLAEISRKTEERRRLEEELRQRREGRTRDTDAAADNAIERSVAARDEQSLTEIEHRIAHGQYGEAQSMLETVIRQTPDNFRAKMRLAEIHYLSERVDAFVELASDLYENHRADIGDDGWARVVRMGKVLAPERPPFSGPIGVVNEH